MERLYIYTPSLLLIGANLLYLLIYGFQNLSYHPSLFIHNFCIFTIIGIVIFFKVSYQLHRWLVLNQGDTKQKVKKSIKQLLIFVQNLFNYLRDGNQINLVYLYAVMASWTFISYFISNIFIGLFVSLLYQVYSILNQQKSFPQQELKQKLWNAILQLAKYVPRYQEMRQDQ